MIFFIRLLWIIAFVGHLPIEGLVFNVSDYGGYPNDNLDDSNATQTAIFLATANGPNNVAMFQPGTYDFQSSVYLYNAINLTVMGHGQYATLLIGHMPTMIFIAVYSERVTIAMLAMDYDPLSFTAGYVVSVTANYLDLQVVSPHRADVGRQVEAILRYDPILMRPSIGPNAYEIYQTPPTNANTSLVSNGTLRIPLASSFQFAVGDAIIARYSFGMHAIYVQDVPDFTLESITIYGAWYMGIFTLRTPRLTIRDYHVSRYNGRWLSTTADCMHFADSREYINIFDSSCEAQGDDGLNVQGFYFQVTQILNSTSLIVRQYNWQEILNIGAGTRLEFSPNSQPFSAYLTATLASNSAYNSNSQIYRFTNPINVSVNDWLCVADTPILTIRNLTVANNRARGALLQTRNIHISQSLFNRTSGPALLLQPTLYWHEGPGTRNTTLEYNMFINCNEGVTQEKGMIAMVPYPVQLLPVMFDIQIKSSTFIYGPFSKSAIQCTNVDGVSISENYFSTVNATVPILLCNAKNVSSSNNRFITNQSSLGPLYTYDTASPCLTNLTNLINLQPSAFNSTFLPPVIATSSGIQINTITTSSTTTTSSVSMAILNTTTSSSGILLNTGSVSQNTAVGLNIFMPCTKYFCHFQLGMLFILLFYLVLLYDIPLNPRF